MNETQATTPTNELRVQVVTDIVASFVSNNVIAINDLPNLIAVTSTAVAAMIDGVSAKVAEPEVRKEPAVSIKKSITPDFLVCLEDGRHLKSLKRHLRTAFNLSPDEYRAKWGLPATYPMVAPNYAAARSALAKQMGLGQGGRQARKDVTAAPKKARVQKTTEAAVA